MENQDIRLLARGEGVPLWRVAEIIGTSESTLTRWLRKPLEPEKKMLLMTALREAKKMQSQR